MKAERDTQIDAAAGGGRPRVSVVVPTHNYGALIAETLRSLQRQTLPDWECVVVDDGSTDDTEGVVRRFAERDGRVRYVRQRNLRQAVAKNTGLRAARGRYVQFLDADDFVEPRKFERQVAYLEAHPEVGIVYGGVRYFTTENPEERLHSMAEDNAPWMPEVSGEGAEVLEALIRENIMVINSPLVRRGVVDKVGRFDARLPPVEDWDYWLRCALSGVRFQFADLPETLALVRVHPASSSSNRVRLFDRRLLVRRKLARSIKDERLRALNRDFRIDEERQFGFDEAARGHSFSAARHLMRAAWLEPKWKWRLKSLAYAPVGPFVSESRLRSMMGASLTGSVKDLGGKGEDA
jgi:glycosyltransferase involved in cell wall biosynthesis